jgi:hypothetical protein
MLKMSTIFSETFLLPFSVFGATLRSASGPVLATVCSVLFPVPPNFVGYSNKFFSYEIPTDRSARERSMFALSQHLRNWHEQRPSKCSSFCDSDRSLLS